MSAITEDAPKELPELDEDSATEEMLRRFMPPEKADAKKPSDKAKGEDKTEAEPKDADDDTDPAEKPEDKSSDDDKGDETEETESETVVKIKVGDEEHEVPVSKLTRLYGQEAALTKKSMEVAEQRKTAEKELSTNAAATQALLQRAKERFDPYSKLDFNLLAAQVGKGELTTEEYQSLRQSAQAAYDDVAFLEKNLTQFMGALQERQQATTREQAKECLKVLSGPEDKGGIPGWNEKLYDDLRSFAVSKGAPSEMVNAIVEPWAFQMMYSAMQFERGKAKGGKIETKKVDKQPKRIVKSTESPASSRSASGKESAKASKAMERLQATGDQDDAAELMLARWASRKAEAD